MVDNIHKAFDDTLTNSYWLDTATKMAILGKLHSIIRLIGYQNWMLRAEFLEGLYDEVNTTNINIIVFFCLKSTRVTLRPK